MATGDTETFAVDLVNDTIPPEAPEVAHHSEVGLRLPFFTHMSRPRPSKPCSLGKQIGVLKADPKKLQIQVEKLLELLGETLRESWTSYFEARFSKALGAAVPIHIEDKARALFVNKPAEFRSAIRVVTALGEVVREHGVSKVDIDDVYDIELETEQITLNLTTNLSPNDAFEHETQILSYLNSRLSDDDKLGIAVRVE